MSKDSENGQNETPVVPYPACHRDITSTVILNLPAESRPKEHVICMSCEQALWNTYVEDGVQQLRCFCRAMFKETWQTYKPVAMLDCDVIYMLEEAAANKE